MRVAPHAGAWIEIYVPLSDMAVSGASHPTRVRGLKSEFEPKTYDKLVVAPHAGAWIEMSASIASRIACAGRTPRGCVD